MKKNKLPRAEEELMGHLWQINSGPLKILIQQYPDPKPAKTTIATLIKRLVDKEMVSYITEGKTRIYSPLVKKKDYFSRHIGQLVTQFFNNSPAQFASFFTQQNDLTLEELESLKALIDNQIEQKK